MKKTAFFLAFTMGVISVSAQTIWNKKLPITSTFNAFSELTFVEDSYWVNSDQGLFQISETGDILGKTNATGFAGFWVWAAKFTSQSTNHPYLLLSRLTVISQGNYKIAHFQPGLGIVNQVEFADSLFSASQSKGHVFVSTNDSTLLVFGHKYIRKIQHREDGAILEAWSKLMPFRSIGAVWTGSQAVFCDPFGNFKAIDASGNLLWEKTHAFTTKSIKLASGGIIGCGNTTAGDGIVFRLDFNGNLLWSKMLPEKKVNDLAGLTDGSIMFTGETDSVSWFAIKTNAIGNFIWAHTYESGKGWEIEQSSDGGAVVLWHAATGSYRLRVAKIDALGNTVPVETERSQVEERTLYTSGAKSTQYPLEGLFFDGANSRLIVPANGTASPIFTHSPWIAGKDAAGSLHIAATTYDNIPADFRAGLASSPAKDFERVWAVSREEIAQIRRDFGEDGDLDAPPPFDLLSWPAKGNPHFRQNLDFSLVTTNPDSLPAPFVDHNGDGTYNVFDGDYPRLLGDRMLWWARTDQTTHEETDGQPLGVDVFFTLYGYDCPQNGGISQSVFADYQIINRSGEDYSNAYMGFFTDFDLGCYDDDYLGSMPDANSYYVYNQDAVDGQPGSTCAGGTATYGEQVPIETVTMLNRSLDHSIYFSRGGTGGPPATTDPTSPHDYYNYLQSIWRDDAPLTIGGSGYNPSNPGAVQTNFAFFDNPSDSQGWSMCTQNLPNADQRMVSSHGPFPFVTGDTFSVRLAFSFHPNIPHPCPDVVGLVKPTILQIQQWHDDGTLDAHLDLGGVLTLAPGQSLLLNATQSNPSTTYSWSTGQSTPSIMVNQTGEYTVTVTPASGCAYSETVLVKSASGTSNPTLPSWQLQPNPTNDVLKIIFEGSETSVTALLRNAQGQMVAIKNNSGNVVEISVANLPTGLYWAELWREGAFLGGRKVVVAR
ncbi:MAG: T9SS type A sorting domain-containing protein [Phycisphaerae bacterium]|nr:T9SS type A sorting domain-containing protein [Saprospiraceae bacterium]